MVAACCADILARTLERCGVKVEILGFTTRAWKGGQAREAWLAAGKPANPGPPQRPAPHHLQAGRCALAARQALARADDARGAAEGEHRRRGAGLGASAPAGPARAPPHPDDDLGRRAGRRLRRCRSTPAATWSSTCARSSRRSRRARSVELIAIGIGHDVTRYYRRAVTITDPTELAGAMTDKLVELFEEDGAGAATAHGQAGAAPQIAVVTLEPGGSIAGGSCRQRCANADMTDLIASSRFSRRRVLRRWLAAAAVGFAVPLHARAQDDKGSAPAKAEAIEITARPIAHFERGRPRREAVRRPGVSRRAGADLAVEAFRRLVGPGHGGGRQQPVRRLRRRRLAVGRHQVRRQRGRPA